MAIERYYKVYPASQYDSLDMSLFHSNPKWSLDQSQFLVEFKEKPHGNTIVLTHQEALELVKNSEWQATFE
jgi:hypothetical protein